MATKEALSKLLPPTELRTRYQALAVLDTIMSPKWQYRLHRFDGQWGDGEQMASIADGSGNNLFIVFAEFGCFLLGFDRESEMSPWARDDNSVWPGMYEGIPDAFLPMVNEPAFSGMQSVTFCLWRLNRDQEWHSGPIQFPDGDEDADGSAYLLESYLSGPEYYEKLCVEYYEQPVALAHIERIYRQEPLTVDLVLAINPNGEPGEVLEEAGKIGYSGT